MRLILAMLLAGSVSFAADAPTLAPSRSQPAIVQSLSTGIYRPATVIFEGNGAKIRFNRGGQILLSLDNPVTNESEEIVGIDQNQNYWAVYVDNEAPEPAPLSSFSGLSAKDFRALQGTEAPMSSGMNGTMCAIFAARSGSSKASAALDAVELSAFRSKRTFPNLYVATGGVTEKNVFLRSGSK